MPDPYDVSRRRRLPDGARFAHVSDLYELPAEILARTVVWCGGSGDPNRASGWIEAERMCQRPAPMHETNLSNVPSSMVVVVAERREHERHPTLTCDEIGCAEGGER